MHRLGRIGLRPNEARPGWQRGGARCEMQKISAGKFHSEPPLHSFNHLVSGAEFGVLSVRVCRQAHVKTEPFPGSLATVTSPPHIGDSEFDKVAAIAHLACRKLLFFCYEGSGGKTRWSARGSCGGLLFIGAVLMRINIWIVLVVLVALLAVTRLSRYQHDTQRLCADDPSASMCAR